MINVIIEAQTKLCGSAEQRELNSACGTGVSVKEEATVTVSFGSESKFTSSAQGRGGVGETSRQKGRRTKTPSATEEIFVEQYRIPWDRILSYWR